MLVRSQPTINETLKEHTVHILSFCASIVGPERVIDSVRRSFPSSPALVGTGTQEISSQLRVQQGVDDAWRVVEGSSTIRTFRSLAELQSFLVWLINSRAVEWLSNDHLLFHAGAVAVGQAGIILPGRSGSGKSTLTAALIAEGCSYFSDEVAVIAPESGSLLPFAKAVKLEPGSVPVLASRFPELDGDGYDKPRTTYLRPPDNVWPTKPASPEFVIFPHYIHGARTRLEAMPRTEGFARLLAHSFSARDHEAEGVRQIVRLLEGCACYDLTVGSLDDAVSQVLQVAGVSPKSGSTSSSQAPHRRFTRAAYRLNTVRSHRQTS